MVALNEDTMSTTETENKEMARKIPEEIFNEGNLDLVDEIFADDYVSRPPEASEPLHGPEELKEFISKFRSAFPEFQVTIKDSIAEDDKVVQRRKFTGTHKGEIMGIEPTGKEIELEAIVIFRMEDGKVVESWEQADMMGLMKQLGLFPPGPKLMVKMVIRKVKSRVLGV